MVFSSIGKYVYSFEIFCYMFLNTCNFFQDVIEERRNDGDSTKPFATPVMAGGLFSIEKQFFYDLGAYDDKMEGTMQVYAYNI